MAVRAMDLHVEVVVDDVQEVLEDEEEVPDGMDRMIAVRDEEELRDIRNNHTLVAVVEVHERHNCPFSNRDNPLHCLHGLHCLHPPLRGIHSFHSFRLDDPF